MQRRYDGQGRLIEEDDRFGQRSRWTYDEVGNRLSVTDPAGTTRTAPDRLNRIARQTTAAGSTELSYSRAGRLQQISHPNGARSETRYDNAGRIDRITHYQGSSIVARFEYAYDDRGNRIEERRIDASGTQRTRYDYDQDDRLTGTTVTAPDSSFTETTYTLDPVGNRTREQIRRGSATVSDIAYTYQAHQRLIETRDRISGVVTEYSYDARGHLISETRSGQTTSYRPNAQDRLATLTLPGAPPVDYAYDSEGKRVERRTPMELTRFGWDGQTLRRETNAANNVIEAHDWAAGRILSSRRLSDSRYAQHDALRSPIRWSQSTGTEQGQLRYDAWGETTDTHPDLPRIAYTGHYREREGTSYYAQQRYYRPGLGRFNRVDPWEGDTARPITLNKYLYANGNPLAYVDPDGRAAHPCVGSEEGCPSSGLSAAQYAAFMDGRIADMGTRDAITTLGQSAEDLITQTQPQAPKGPTMSAPWEGRLTPLQASAHAERVRRAEARLTERRMENAVSLVLPWSNEPGGVQGWQKVNVFDGQPMTASERDGALLDVMSAVALWQPTSRLSALQAPRVIRSSAASAEQRLLQQAQPAVVTEAPIAYGVPRRPLSPSQRADARAKIEDRSITREAYEHFRWDRRLQNRRRAGVEEFWDMERERLIAGQPGTRSWSDEQIQQILSGRTPKHDGMPIEGHHLYSVLDYPQIANEGRYIYPATRPEHLYRWHGGSTRNATHGQPLNPAYPEEF